MQIVPLDVMAGTAGRTLSVSRMRSDGHGPISKDASGEMSKMWGICGRCQCFRAGVPNMRQSRLIRFLYADRAAVEQLADELRNLYLDHDGQAISSHGGMLMAMGCSQATVEQMRAYVDDRIPPPGKPR